MERTPRYQLTYPTSSDEVDDAPQQFKTMCESVETALAMVDDRQTSEAVKPVVRTTFAQLTEAGGVTGQTGYVTDEGANTGMYVYDGSAWHHAYTYTVDDIELTYLVNDESGWTVRYMVRHGFVWVRANISKTGTGNWGKITCPAKLPEALRPVLQYTIRPINANTQSNISIDFMEDGTISANRLGGSITSDDVTAVAVYPVG